MILSLLRNFKARLTRTILTVAGIAIGILALVVVGSLAERLQTIVTRSTALSANVIFAFASGRELYGAGATARMQRNIVQIAHFDGVLAVVPEVVLPYGTGFVQSDRFGPPSLIFGFPERARRLATNALAVAVGRDFGLRERRVAVVGPDYASSSGSRVGDTIALYGNSFEIVGTLEKSFTIFDAAVIVPLPDARRLLAQIVPPTAAFAAAPPASALMVITRPRAQTGLIARRIALFTGLQARDPAEVAGSIRSTTQIFDAIIFGSALVALVVGAFSIVNTMTIAVSERTREIGIRKAIGARDADILREFIVEAATLGIFGGCLGLALGAGIVTFVNAHNAAHGNLELFAVTPRLGFGSLAFAVVLSALAGLLPAIRAARLDPIDALRRGA